MKAALVLLDMERPVGIKVSAEVDGSELDDGLGHVLCPAHTGSLHPVLDEVLACAFDRAAGDRPAVSEILVIAHTGAIAVKVGRDAQQRFARGTGEFALGDALADALDDLTNLAGQYSQSTFHHPEFGLDAAFGVEYVGGFPEFLQNV